MYLFKHNGANSLGMMVNKINSIIVVGAGPAAAAFCTKLFEKGHKVTVILEGNLSRVSHQNRISKIDNGEEVWKLSNTQESVKVNLDEYQNFKHISIRGSGGLSSRWGGGIAKLTHIDMNIGETVANKIDSYYDFAHNMIGTNNNIGDPLSSYIGNFDSPHIHREKLDHITRLKYSTDKVVFGKSMQAIWHASHPETARKACNLCGHCSTFCGRGSFYNAQHSFENLNHFHQIFENTKVFDVKKSGAGYEIVAVQGGKQISLKADVLIMAAGPVNTYKILKKTLLAEISNSATILNTPVIRGVAFSPFHQMKKNTTVANTMACIEINPCEKAVVSFVNGSEIPVSDWLSFLPFKNRVLASFISVIRKYFMAYMIFFSSDNSQNTLEVVADEIQIKGQNKGEFKATSKIALRQFKKFLLKNRFIDVPFLSAVLIPGRDIHYGGSLPMNGEGQFATNTECELVGNKNIFIIDGSWMPRMSEKFHTLTLMANAARVADNLSSRMNDD